MDRFRRLTPAARIAVVATGGGVVGFAWFVSGMPFSKADTGSGVGLAFAVVSTAAMIFAPQVLVVFLLATKDRGQRIAGVVFGGLAAIAGLGVGAIWASGAEFEGQSYDFKALGLWVPLILMGIIDGVAAAVTWLSLRRDHLSTLRQAPTA